MVERPTTERLYSIRRDGSHRKLHPADVRGRFLTARRAAFAALIAVYVGLPFARIGGRPAVHLDLPARRFFLFGAAFNAQDIWLVVFLLAAVGLGLLFATAWLGRVWCGWACPQTVFLDGVYRRIERALEGPRAARLRDASAPWTVRRAARWAVKQALFLAVSFLVAHAALALFLPVGELAAAIRDGPAGHETAFAWAVGLTAITHLNFAWFREQTCVLVCPYGRFQSILTDDHSLIVGYDRARGEPRTKPRKLPVVTKAGGDCVDCGKCVAVCPTGIDIRDGLQMECIACAQCIDACDGVMDKLGRPRGLVRYDSLQGFAGKPTSAVRGRTVAYGALFAAAVVAAVASAVSFRTPFEANLLRAGGTPWVLEGASIRDQFELHLINKNPSEASFALELAVPPPATGVLAQSELRLASLQSLRVPIFVSIAGDRFCAPFDVSLVVHDRTSGQRKTVTGKFLGPPGACR